MSIKARKRGLFTKDNSQFIRRETGRTRIGGKKISSWPQNRPSHQNLWYGCKRTHSRHGYALLSLQRCRVRDNRGATSSRVVVNTYLSKLHLAQVVKYFCCYRIHLTQHVFHQLFSRSVVRAFDSGLAGSEWKHRSVPHVPDGRDESRNFR